LPGVSVEWKVTGSSRKEQRYRERQHPATGFLCLPITPHTSTLHLSHNHPIINSLKTGPDPAADPSIQLSPSFLVDTPMKKIDQVENSSTYHDPPLAILPMIGDHLLQYML